MKFAFWFHDLYLLKILATFDGKNLNKTSILIFDFLHTHKKTISEEQKLFNICMHFKIY